MSRNDWTARLLRGALAVCLAAAVVPSEGAAAYDAGSPPAISAAGRGRVTAYGRAGRVGLAPWEHEEDSGWEEMPRVAQRGEVTPEKLKRWRSMTPEERERIRRRYHRWKELPPERRERILEGRKRWRELPEEQRRSLMRRREIYRSAPPEEKKAIEKLFRHWRTLPPERRHAMRRDLADMRDLPAPARNERLKDWPFYRQLSPGERNAVSRFLFPGPQQGPKRGLPGAPRD